MRYSESAIIRKFHECFFILLASVQNACETIVELSTGKFTVYL